MKNEILIDRRIVTCGLMMAWLLFGALLSEATEDHTTPPGTFLGADLITEDAASAEAFYTGLFGWESEKVRDGYALRHQGRLVASVTQIDGTMPDVTESFWLVALAVNNIDLSVKSAGERNAVVHEKVTTIEDGYGRVAVIGDAEKAPVMLIEPGKNPIGGTTGPGSWAWAELWSDDIDTAAGFYADVIGVGHDEIDRGGQPYHVFTSQGKARAGIIRIPAEFERVEPGWAPYVAVADLSASTAKTRELGGTVVFSNTEHPAQAAVALILDPSGAALFLYQIGSVEGAEK